MADDNDNDNDNGGSESSGGMGSGVSDSGGMGSGISSGDSGFGDSSDSAGLGGGISSGDSGFSGGDRNDNSSGTYGSGGITSSGDYIGSYGSYTSSPSYDINVTTTSQEYVKDPVTGNWVTKGQQATSASTYSQGPGDTWSGFSIGSDGERKAEDISGFMDRSHTSLEASQAWRRGDYGDWLSSSLESMGYSIADSIERNINQFTSAPLDYVSDLVDNPLVSAGLAFSGLGLTAFGVKAVDAFADYVQGESTLAQSATQIGGGLLSSTAIGASLGPMRSIAAAGLAGGGLAAAQAAAGKLGAQAGALSGRQLGALTGNPYAQAAATAIGAAVGSRYASGAVSGSRNVSSTSSGTPSGSQGNGGAERVSALVSQGSQAVQAHRQLQNQDPNVDLYAQTVAVLPFYGIGLDSNNYA